MSHQTGYGGRDGVCAFFAQFDVFAVNLSLILPKPFKREGSFPFFVGESQLHSQIFCKRLSGFLIPYSYLKAMRESRQKFVRLFNGFWGVSLFSQFRRHGGLSYLEVSCFDFADFLVDISYGTGVVRRAVARGKTTPGRTRKKADCRIVELSHDHCLTENTLESARVGLF